MKIKDFIAYCEKTFPNYSGNMDFVIKQNELLCVYKNQIVLASLTEGKVVIW